MGTSIINRYPLAGAIFPYLLMTVIVLLGQVVFKENLSIITLNPSFPEVTTSFGWRIPAGPGRSISLFGHAGALLLYTSLISFLWFRWQGGFDRNRAYSGLRIIRKTVKGSVKSTIGIVTLVAMAVTMHHSGMTQMLAEALSSGTGPVFPLINPFIGVLGAFMTGSNTNSNVVFGQLQLQTATALNLTIPLLLAAQTAGGAIGSLFAPAKVIVGCSTVDGSEDSRVLAKATVYGLAITTVVGLVVWLIVKLG
jgi:lactate permease